MAKVTKLTVSGYKSIRDLNDFALRDLNVLIGANGAGKSNFIGLFRMLAEMMDQRLQLYVQRQGGPDALLHFTRKTTERIHAEFYFDNNGYRFDLVPTQDNRLIFEDERTWFGGYYYPGNSSISLGSGHAEALIKSSTDKYSPYVRPAIQNWRVYHFHDTGDTAKVKQPHAANDTLRLKVDGANLAAFLRMLSVQYPSNYRAIEDTIQLAAPFFDGFVQREDPAQTIQLEWRERGDPDTPFSAHALSDGTLRFICLATLLLQPASLRPSTVLIDEPELGLHPYAINLLADMLKQAAEQTQLIVSTQSVELLNCLSPEDVIVVDRDGDASAFRRLDTTQLTNWLEDYSLGELWKQNVLGGRPA